MNDFRLLLEELLVAEHGKTAEEAARLVKKHSRIVVQGIMAGMSSTHLRAAAIAIELAESEEGGQQ